jgi:hypothetical protein
LSVASAGKPGFTLLPADQTGILFSNSIPVSVSLTNQILLDGSGVAAGDVDGDGWCDLYFCAIDGENVLYRNRGSWRFEKVTDQPPLACAGLRSTGAVFADLDGDGDLDLIVNTTGHGTRIFYNDAKGRFTPAGTHLNPGLQGGRSLALADVDGDGYLDVYVVNYRTTSVMDTPNVFVNYKVVDGRQTVATFNGRPVTDPDLVNRFAIGPAGDFQENGQPDLLYRNLGGTNFLPVSFTDGSFLDEAGRPLSKAPLDWGLAAMFRDVNGDHLPDLYVCNDFQSPDRFWINQGGGKFRLLPAPAQRKSSMSSMAVDFADINRDGHDDFFVMDMMSREHAERMRFLSVMSDHSVPADASVDRPQYEFNTLFLNRGDTTFAEIAQLSGVEAAEWAWSCIFLDVDLDGFEDLLVVNGIERTGRDLDTLDYIKQLRRKGPVTDAQIFQARLRFPRQANGNLAFRNRGDLTFEEISRSWGFDWKGSSTTMALADLDNDGDQDVVVSPVNGPALIYRNEADASRLSIRLKGKPPNTHGIGARIRVWGGPVPVQTQEFISGGRYLANDESLRCFATGSATNLAIQVAWRSGSVSTISNAMPNHLYVVEEAAAVTPASVAKPDRETPSPPLFEDVSSRLLHSHRDQPFDDFARQPLLPNQLSQLGPGLAWLDVNADGREDLVVGSGAGGQPGIFLNDAAGHFKRLDEPGLSVAAKRDQTSVLGWMLSTNQSLLLVGCANYEDGQAQGPAVQLYDFGAKRIRDVLPAFSSSAGPLALADLTGQGRPTLFVGGRVVPGRYPEPAASRLYSYSEGNWRADLENTRALAAVGLVSAARFSDLTGDGFPELILACDWGPVRVFRNHTGKLTPWDIPLVPPLAVRGSEPATALNQLKGWWNSVAAGDFDSDGRMDLVAGNWGRNTKYQSRRSRPLTLYYGDFAGDGTIQIVECHYEPPLSKTVPMRQLGDLARGMPFVRGTFRSNEAYSTASVEQVLGARINAATKLEVNWLESTLFLNRGDHFEVRVLPIEAQLSPVFGLTVADFDGDGNEDLLLAQNFFATQPETPRYDAGRGVLLRGDGTGRFEPVSSGQSGLRIYGEQRGAAACDFDADGRMDLVVAQNGAETRLFRNSAGLPGLRVKLTGSGTNPQAFGSVIRVKRGNQWGAARELHAGSGYWSQDSAVQVFGCPATATEIQVLWPDGKMTASKIPLPALEVSLRSNGDILVTR